MGFSLPCGWFGFPKDTQHGLVLSTYPPLFCCVMVETILWRVAETWELLLSGLLLWWEEVVSTVNHTTHSLATTLTHKYCWTLKKVPNCPLAVRRPLRMMFSLKGLSHETGTNHALCWRIGLSWYILYVTWNLIFFMVSPSFNINNCSSSMPPCCFLIHSSSAFSKPNINYMK